MDAQSARVSPDIVIAWFAARQHGLAAYRQLVGAGVGRGAIAHRVRTRRLISVHRGVYAVGHLHRSNAVRWMAAVLACGDGTLLSHTSALALWDLRPSSAARTHVTVRGRAGRKPREQIVVHRSTLLPAEEIATHRDIPVTSVARTLLDVAAGLQPYALSGRSSRSAPHIISRGRSSTASSRTRRSTFSGPTAGSSQRPTGARRTSPAPPSSATARRTRSS